MRNVLFCMMVLLPVLVAGEETVSAPELGWALNADEAAAGWISLFDGQTSFGWSGSDVRAGVLSGGKTTARFSRFDLRADAAHRGVLWAGGERFEVAAGEVRLTISGRLEPIELTDGSAVRYLCIQPLDLEPISRGTNLERWRVVRCGEEKKDIQPIWRVENNFIHAGGGPGALEYPGLYADFMLQIDVQTLAPRVNSGFFFRNIPGVCLMGYEAQILNLSAEGDPSQPAGYTTGAIDDRMPARRLVSRDRITFTMTVLADGPHLATWVNGYQVVDWTDERTVNRNPRVGLCTEPGTFQLQAHDPQTDIDFKNIRVMTLR